tara:strand:- start:279 stop:488 length:210 start_codon:yes stop_codon:yes gene_type:complete
MAKAKIKDAPYVTCTSMSGRVIKVFEDNLDYCLDLKARGRVITDPHGLLDKFSKHHRDYLGLPPLKKTD